MRREFLFCSSLVMVLTIGAASDCIDAAPAAPDFSGIWTHPFWPGFDPPLAGPGPVANRSRTPSGIGDSNQLVGDYGNPILKPQAAEIVRKLGEISLSGVTYPTPANQCWPQPVPYILWTIGIQLLQQPGKVTILYSNPDHEMRQVRMNQPHPARVIPSWYGDSVGHYEGNTLVVDTVGIKAARPFAMVDVYGTPYTETLHVVERYRLVDDAAAKAADARTRRENLYIPFNDSGLAVDEGYKGKALQLAFTVDDPGAWPEFACSENQRGFYAGGGPQIPRAAKPDF